MVLLTPCSPGGWRRRAGTGKGWPTRRAVPFHTLWLAGRPLNSELSLTLRRLRSRFFGWLNCRSLIKLDRCGLFPAVRVGCESDIRWVFLAIADCLFPCWINAGAYCLLHTDVLSFSVIFIGQCRGVNDDLRFCESHDERRIEAV